MPSRHLPSLRSVNNGTRNQPLTVNVDIPPGFLEHSLPSPSARLSDKVYQYLSQF